MTKNKYIKPFKTKIYPNKVEYSTPLGMYYTTNDLKAKSFMKKFQAEILSHTDFMLITMKLN